MSDTRQRFINTVRNTIAAGVLSLLNRQRAQADTLEYILFQLADGMPTLPDRRGWLRRRVLGQPSLSLWELHRHFERIAEDPRPKGVILFLRPLALPLADLQTLRDSISTLRESGKRVVVYAQEYDLARYYVASAADEILIQPSGNVFTVGLRTEALFLKDALDEIGVAFDSVAISPYKGAADTVTRNDISPEAREQVDWILDSRYDMLVSGIAEGRGLTTARVREMLDNAPYLDTFAKGIGMVDGIAYEEELYRYLECKHIHTWEEADKMLRINWEAPHHKYVAVLKIEGLMVPGESANPPGDIPVPVVNNGRAGDITVTRQVRALMQDENAAAVVLFVDSSGGAASAAEAMRSALAELNYTRPVVVYMNGVAASGGYLVSTPSRYIVAQPGTITGSIGVIFTKPVTGDLRSKLRINAVEFLRGGNADILSVTKPFSDGQRDWVRESIERTYDVFLTHVARSRDMEKADVDKVGGGRVWTGAQALEHGLVDALGGVHTAIAKARELAELPENTPVAIVAAKAKPVGPQVAEAANPAAYLRYLRGNVGALLSNAPMLLTPFFFRD